MSRLGGQFAGILRMEIPAERERALIVALKELEPAGLTVVVQPDEPKREPKAARQNVLEIVGQDRPGIVQQISHALAGYGVNVEELQTECASAAMSGETLFRAKAKLSIPESSNVGEIRRTLEKIAEDLIVEITLAEVPSAKKS